MKEPNPALEAAQNILQVLRELGADKVVDVRLQLITHDIEKKKQPKMPMKPASPPDEDADDDADADAEED